MENFTIPPDDRNSYWASLESDIQESSKTKDGAFILSGPWKKFWRKEGDLDVYRVNGDWVRSNLSVIFGHGGHGCVHEFIPHGELWIDTHHHPKCSCKNLPEDRKMSDRYADSTTLHEGIEYSKMKKGAPYWEAHNIALQEELKAALIPDPYSEI